MNRTREAVKLLESGIQFCKTDCGQLLMLQHLSGASHWKAFCAPNVYLGDANYSFGRSGEWTETGTLKAAKASAHLLQREQ